MAKILSSDPITPADFITRYLGGVPTGVETIQDLYDYISEITEASGNDYWDFPIEETKDLVEGDYYPVVLVKDPVSGEMRWFETEATGSVF